MKFVEGNGQDLFDFLQSKRKETENWLEVSGAILFRGFHHHLPEHKQCPSQGQESSPPAYRTDTKKVYCKRQLFSTQEYWYLLIWQSINTCAKISRTRRAF